MAFQPSISTSLWGVQEIMIKAAKKAIYGNLGTAFTGAEALINSRPSKYQTTNPDDDVLLTPNHFLPGQIGGQFAPESVDENDFNVKKRWRRIQELVKHFWQRWLRERLLRLNSRKKRFNPQKDLQVGEEEEM